MPTESIDGALPQSFGNNVESDNSMELPQLYDQNDAGRSASSVNPVSPQDSEDMLLDMDLSYTSSDESLVEEEGEEDDGFITDSLLLASISPLITLTVKEAALIIEEWRVQSNLSNQVFTGFLTLLPQLIGNCCLPQTWYKWKTLVKRMTYNPSVIKLPSCPNGCLAFTGDLKNLKSCTVCTQLAVSESGKYRSYLAYIPLIPCLKVLMKSPKYRSLIQYQSTHRKTDGITDILDGYHYQNLKSQGFFENLYDHAFALALDGFSLNKYTVGKACWPIILINLNLPPSERYKSYNILILSIISGPKSPVLIDSFLEPLIAEFERLSNGVQMGEYFVKANIIICIGDTPAISKLGGFCGHNALSCCRFCQINGVYSTKHTHYYYPNTTPNSMILPSRSRTDFNMLTDINLPNSQSNIKLGISRKPKIILLKGISWSQSFPLGTMHLLFNNIPILLTQLYSGKFNLNEPYKIGSKFESIGKMVENVKIPSYFTRTPINIHSSRRLYKCKDWKYWICIYSSGILKRYLPDKYWQHWELFVDIVNIFLRHQLTLADLRQIQQLCEDFVIGYEKLYYRFKEDRLNLCRYSIHSLLHLSQCLEIIGPCYTFWEFPMERTCGEMMLRVKSSVLPYANLINNVSAKSVMDVMRWVKETPEYINHPTQSSFQCAHGFLHCLSTITATKPNPWTQSKYPYNVDYFVLVII